MRLAIPCLLGTILMTAAVSITHAAATPSGNAQTSVTPFDSYQVVELRRYDTAPNQRARFVSYFDAYFPEAFEQLGCMVYGQFYDRSAPTHFTWLRGFRDMNARAVALAGFYYGPVWREHREKVNALIPGASDNVLLLRPLTPQTGVSVLPAVDPVDEPHGAQGIVVAQIFAVKKGQEGAFAKLAESTFARYQDAGIRPAGVLVTLDESNNFPQLPIRTDGPFLVWLGIVRDKETLAGRFSSLKKQVGETLTASGMLRNAPENLVLDPTPRSRLRWVQADDRGASP